MRFNAAGKRRGAVISMTPLIDMMFLLVIFILIVARFEPDAGVKVNLPSGAAPLDTPRKAMSLFVTRDREVFLEDRPVTTAEFPERLKDLRAAIQAEEGADSNPVLVIYGDRETDYGFVTELIIAARQAGQTSVSLKTRAAAE